MGAITYREATLDDAALAADIMTAAYPAFAHDPVMTRLRWSQPKRGFAYGRFIGERHGRSIAFLDWVHGPWEEVADGHCEIEVWLERKSVDVDLLVKMTSWIEERAVAEGTRLLLSYCAEDEPELRQALAALGYTPERVEKVSELNLKVHGPSLVELAQEAREKMAAGGIGFTTLAGWGDADRTRKLYELINATIQDVPHSVVIVPETYEDFELRLDAPDRPPDRVWIALKGDRSVAMSYLRFPPVRGTVWTGYTCTHPDFRGRGLARGIKLQTLAQAVELGIPIVCTTNDAENAPILSINKALGYKPRPGFVEHHKRVERRGNG
jgi:GNAT superfamily N-acetyltransferase